VTQFQVLFMIGTLGLSYLYTTFFSSSEPKTLKTDNSALYNITLLKSKSNNHYDKKINLFFHLFLFSE
jgi:hypothetical protein